LNRAEFLRAHYTKAASQSCLVCGFVILSIILVIPLAYNLTSDGTKELAFIGMGLAFGLWEWNKARAKSKLTAASPPERQSS
jgi:hypothetical protein